MARCLIIGCGCRGGALAARLLEGGHAVRGTTRRPERAAELESLGAEAWLGDPDLISTLARALDHVTLACVLLGTARGTRDQLEALHGPRLEMLLTRMLDTTIRGIVYEASGTVDSDLLGGGADRVRGACEDARIPYRLLDADPGDHPGWADAAESAVASLLGGSVAAGEPLGRDGG